MTKRRDVLKFGLAGAGAGMAWDLGSAKGGTIPQSGLLFPQTERPSIVDRPSPPATPFAASFNIMPIAQPVPKSSLIPGPDPLRHQRYNEFPPQKFYTESISEFRWQYHPEPPYDQGTWSWGFNGITPGPTYHAKYGEPIFVRRLNNLPPVGTGEATFPLPSVSIHLHNGHTASESDGIPQDYFDPGEFWDHHYANFPAGFDDREIMSTLWYHDHRLDFTAPNVYAGLSGFYSLFDDKDSNNERDTSPQAFRLPSGDYDIPMILHDVQFDEFGQVIWDFFNPEPDLGTMLPSSLYTTNGMLGDRFTVNRIIQPHLKVERRKYRFRILNGGPSRLYDLSLRAESGHGRGARNGLEFYVLSSEGNMFEEPIKTDHFELWVAQRRDVIIDFSHFRDGDHVYLVNRLEMREDGAGPSGRELDEGDLIMRFDVEGRRQRDPSRIPDQLRELPDINMDEVRRERLFVFDYDNGLWTINGKLMDPNRADARIEQGSAEIWTFRNTGNSWAHPVHSHFEEFQILEVNGRPIEKGDLRRSRKDVVALGPNDEVRFFGRWRDFLGKYVMHCHNVVHEDHAMMIRWDIVPPGEGD
jgi:FtsP/CotA-like multicopper oxidase with cupredoxin domain